MDVLVPWTFSAAAGKSASLPAMEEPALHAGVGSLRGPDPPKAGCSLGEAGCVLVSRLTLIGLWD